MLSLLKKNTLYNLNFGWNGMSIIYLYFILKVSMYLNLKTGNNILKGKILD